MGWGSYLTQQIASWRADIRGATAIEYALIAAGISLMLVLCVFVFGEEINQFFFDMAAALDV